MSHPEQNSPAATQESQALAERIGQWLARMPFAQHLGIRFEGAAPGFGRCAMTIADEHLNMVGIAHGGVVFALADTTFGVACNSDGRVAVALSAHIAFHAPTRVGETLIAEAHRVSQSRHTGHYRVDVTNAEGRAIAQFTGVAYRREDAVEKWMEEAGPQQSE
ncbi:hydroxyphenylacetyl-CoA thioesterase PaaI [Magnetofaba australis]|uniref:Putative phenylacetic acid degradation-related protein n=1 Tax=Magnetofaba australis IT-1 TaxID=1434232 RepID=A0A1Y2K114_9PROT|nr:hydroxyphenylacetyl-CoA thioesterase PaaI [Magnetofaba australis]OSM01740.1 putative phenylacetic acid degradation-related protein [Magnetofaba australis IT-1]